MRVPRLVHLIWVQGEDAMPAKFRPSVEQWARVAPHWTARVWSGADVAELVRVRYPEFERFWHKQPVIIQADLARCFLLDTYGGVYCDVDFFPVAAPDEVVDSAARPSLAHVFLIGAAQFDGWLNNSFLASTPGNPIWREVVLPAALRRLQEFDEGRMWGGAWRVEATAGPWFWRHEVGPQLHWLKYGATVVPHARVNGPGMPSHKGPPTPEMRAALLRAGALGYHWSEQSWTVGPEKLLSLFNDHALAWYALYALIGVLLLYGVYRASFERVGGLGAALPSLDAALPGGQRAGAAPPAGAPLY